MREGKPLSDPPRRIATSPYRATQPFQSCGRKLGIPHKALEREIRASVYYWTIKGVGPLKKETS